MMVPDYWAEASEKFVSEDGQRTIHRFGWSNESESAASEHAAARVADAITRLREGESVLVREPKVPYNGADGLPIREEVIERHGDSLSSEVVLTRNSYGAICLNTPNVLFADVDLPKDTGCWFYVVSFVIAFSGLLTLAIRLGVESPFWMVLFASILLAGVLGSAFHWMRNWWQGSPRGHARKRIEAFAAKHPQWIMRLYETPNGWRVLVTHDVFDPRGESAQEFFQAIGTDPLYVRMCFNQNCFRARVTPKPWRIGMDARIRPRPGVWPINKHRIADREAWVRQYDESRRGFAACRYVATIGMTNRISRCEDAEFVRRLHDQWCDVGHDQRIA